MNKRTIDEMIAHINQEVSNMDIAREYKMKLLGMITAIGYEIKKQDVVRCKDCKYCYSEGFVNVRNVCEKHYDFGNVDDDWFCADGERRDDGQIQQSN